MAKAGVEPTKLVGFLWGWAPVRASEGKSREFSQYPNYCALRGHLRRGVGCSRFRHLPSIPLAPGRKDQKKKFPAGLMLQFRGAFPAR